MTDEQQKRMAELKAKPARSQAEELEFRVLSWFTDYADPVRGWDLASAAAHPEMEINTVADLANAVLNSQLHLLKGAGHELWCERPDELRNLLNRLVVSTT